MFFQDCWTGQETMEKMVCPSPCAIDEDPSQLVATTAKGIFCIVHHKPLWLLFFCISYHDALTRVIATNKHD
jgi:hypothetical protein